jgi:hypothetical protein
MDGWTDDPSTVAHDAKLARSETRTLLVRTAEIDPRGGTRCYETAHEGANPRWRPDLASTQMARYEFALRCLLVPLP